MIAIIVGVIGVIGFAVDWLIAPSFSSTAGVILSYMFMMMGFNMYFELKHPEPASYYPGAILETKEGRWTFTVYDTFGEEIKSRNTWSKFNWAEAAQKAYCGQSV